MKVFINPGHSPGGVPDPGAVGVGGIRECDVALSVGKMVKGYLEAVGIATELLQSNSLNGEDEDADNPSICGRANASGAELFISIHCNSFNTRARGTECCVFSTTGKASQLAWCIQRQITDSLGTADRGLKERRDLAVLKHTTMSAVLVELAFIDNEADCRLLEAKQDDLARAIARGVTDYLGGN